GLAWKYGRYDGVAIATPADQTDNACCSASATPAGASAYTDASRPTRKASDGEDLPRCGGSIGQAGYHQPDGRTAPFRGINLHLPFQPQTALGETGKPCTGPACRGVEAATIIAHFDGQLSPLAHDGHSDACGAAVLQHVGQAFLQESQQVEAACGPES